MVQTWEARVRVIEQTQRELDNLTLSASQQAESAFRLTNATLIDIVERVEADHTGPSQLERIRGVMIQKYDSAAPMLEDLVLTDASGLAVVDARPKTPRIDLGDREYFQHLLRQSGDQAYVGLPVQSRLTGSWILPVARRVNDNDGGFAGIVIATLKLAFFKDFYATFKLGHDGAAAIWRSDGTLLARQAWTAPIIKRGSESGSPVRYVFPDAATGSYDVVSQVDGFSRTLSFRRLPGYPLVVAVALGKNEQLAGWRTGAVQHLLGAVCISLVLGFLGSRLVAQTKWSAAADRANFLATTAANERLNHLAKHLAKARDRAEQADRAKTHFLAGMSHELRTPLNGILGYARLLRMDGDLNKTQAMRVDAMLGAGKHLLEMITSVLDLSEIEAEHVKLQSVTFDLQATAAACLDLIRPAAEAKGLALGMTVAPGTPTEIIADATRLRQLLLNLLGNATKFTIRGAIDLRLRSAADGSVLRIEVADTGPGIPAAQRQHLFQDFERLGAGANQAIEGAGLGLALSARLAGLMGGQIGHADNPSGGSVFWLELPLRMPDQSTPVLPHDANGPHVPAAPLAMRTLQVLVADDALMNRDIASAFLRAAGHQVTLAGDGVEAVEAVASTDFDVVLMDVRMPRMDGLEATRRIRALASPRSGVPIVALTAQAFTDHVEQCREAGMDSHLAKPFDMETLLAGVIAAAGARHQPDPAPDPDSWLSSVLAKAGTPSIEQPMEVLNTAVFERTASFLAPETVASYMQTIAELGDILLRGLREPDASARANNMLMETAHTLAGSAGMFGFERLASAGRSFERAVQFGEAQAPALAGQLCLAIEATLPRIPDR